MPKHVQMRLRANQVGVAAEYLAEDGWHLHELYRFQLRGAGYISPAADMDEIKSLLQTAGQRAGVRVAVEIDRN